MIQDTNNNPSGYRGTRNQILMIAIGLILLIITSSFLIFNKKDSHSNKIVVTNFEECKNAGYGITEGHPSKCYDAEGNKFLEFPETTDSTSGTKGSCYTGGCSNEVCSDHKGVVSNCIYKEEFGCYRAASCERQSDGKCGWTETPVLRECINTSIKFSENLQ
ncbi:MAG: hypothetical protein V4469_03185 [Patescibacteria group bacterium]